MSHRILASRPRASRGIALIMTLGVIILLTLAVLTAASNATGNLAHVSLQVYEKQAVRAAEAGLADAVLAIRADQTWRGFAPAERTLPSNPSSSYLVEATNNIAGTGAIAASDGTVVPVGAVYLRSTGQSTRGIQRVVTALAVMGSNHVFRYTIFGVKNVALTGSSVVDTWNSNFGPYVPPTTPTVGAIVATNGATASSISLGGNTYVDANLYVGPGADAATSVSGASKATGTVTVSTSVVPMPAPSPPPLPPPPYTDLKVKNSTFLAPGTYGNLSASGNATITLQTGTYVFSNVSLTGGTSIVVPAGVGPVKIYFTGTWDTSGGNLVNQTGQAANLLIAGTSTATSAKIAGGSEAYYGFYAPTAAVTLVGNSAVYGSVIGATVNIPGNAAVHYDQALGANTTFDLRTNWVLTGIHRG